MRFASTAGAPTSIEIVMALFYFRLFRSCRLCLPLFLELTPSLLRIASFCRAC